MGEVYRATDTHAESVGRDQSPARLFAGDADRLARFQREAEVLASLNHPNIGAIYGVEEAGDVHALVLELVEGQTLAREARRAQRPRASGSTKRWRSRGRSPTRSTRRTSAASSTAI